LLKIAGSGACGTEMKSFFRSLFSLSSFDFLDVHTKPNRLKPVLLGLLRSRCFGSTRAS
jgi:hypothetical protein